MEVITRAYIGMAAIVAFLLAAAFPAALGAVHLSAAPAPAPVPTSDGTTIDQGIAYVLMLVALVLTYIIH